MLRKLFTLGVSISLLFSVFVIQAHAANTDFPDVPDTHANYEAINFLQSREIINGYADGTFKPNNSISRVESLKILLLGSGIDIEEKLSDFPDIPQTHWGQKYVYTAKEKGIVNGNKDGTFKPDNTVNKAEALKILLKINGITPAVPETKPYTDTELADWFTPYASYAKEKNLIDSNEKNTFVPSEELTRAKLAEIMYRLAYIQENELSSFQITNERPEKIIKVYDGDTLTTKHGEKIRVIGINTPEKGELYDPEATTLTRDLTLDKKVILTVCEEEPRDRYGRTLAYVTSPEGLSLSEELLRNGLAKAYYIAPCGEETEEYYAQLEKTAQQKQLGIWSEENIAAENSEDTSQDSTKDAQSQTSPNEETGEIPENSIQLIEVHPDAEGADKENLNDEYIIFKNVSNEDIVLTGYIISDAQNHEYEFPVFTLKLGKKVTLHVGSGEDTATNLYMGLDAPIWNNSGDTVILKNLQGEIIFEQSFTKNTKY